MKLFLFVGIFLICAQPFFAQSGCSGATLFTESKCAGDEISPTEKELFRIINEYRAQNNLPPVTLNDKKIPESLANSGGWEKTFQVRINAENYLTVIVKSNLNPLAKEV